MRKQWMEVIEQRQIAHDIFHLTMKGELVQDISGPGQFVHIRVTNGQAPLLRRPISISSYDKTENTMVCIYRAEGIGTQLLSTVKQGEQLDVLGPLGTGFPVEAAATGEKALLVGGGIGVPPLYELAQQLHAKGVHVTTVLGFQTKDVVFYEEQFKQFGAAYVATVDGTHGTKGFVTHVIDNEQLQFNILYTCGPKAMLKSLSERYPNERVYLSLEERMGCGIGACFACVTRVPEDPTGATYKKVCTDGPVFCNGEVVL